MTDPSAKERILQSAVAQFSQKGFHGTSMRDIAEASACSMPTLYYHYKSKADLFEEIVVHQFLLITERMNQAIDANAEPLDIYCGVIQSRKDLKGFDRDVYKMALKVWLGFEGEGTARDKVMEWENKRADANRRFIGKVVAEGILREDVTELLIGYMESIINRIILLGEDVDEDRVRRQLSLLFKIGQSL